MYNLLYLSIGAFWRNSMFAFFRNHDILFKYTDKKLPLQIHLGIPMKGETFFKGLLEGDDRNVIKTWKCLNYKVYESLYEGTFDGLLINGSEDFWDITLPDETTLSGQDINKYVLNKCEEAMKDNKPVILYDTDGFILNMVKSSDKPSLSKRIYDLCKDYNKFTVQRPFEESLNLECREMFLPFTLDPETAREDIVPYEEREYFTRYVGNNYFRDNFVPYFKASTNYGKVQVCGSKWDKYHEEIPEIEWKHKFPLTLDKSKEYYSNAKVGLYGTAGSHKELKHFTLRIREFYDAGVFIIPEDEEYLTEKICLDENRITTTDLLNNKEINIKDNYEELVLKQRKKIEQFFNAELYVDEFVKLLTM